MRSIRYKKLKKRRFFWRGLFIVFVFFFVWQPILPELKQVQAKETQDQRSEFSPDLGHKGASIRMAKKDWTPGTAPELKMKYPDRGFMRNSFRSFLSIFYRKRVEVKLVPVKKDETILLRQGKDYFVSYSLSGASVELSPLAQIKARKYELEVRLNRAGEEFSFSQDFTWGVLAVNTNKSVYAPNEEASISMAVLNELGEMDCDAKLHLKIENSEQGISEELSIDNGKILLNRKTCQSKNFTLDPDYWAVYSIKGPGTYNLTLTSETSNGSFTITDHFEVQDNALFSVERKTATRIYPLNKYPVIFNITANQDFKGKIIEEVPESFEIENLPAGEAGLDIENSIEISNFKFKILNQFQISNDKNKKQLIWDADIKKGDQFSLGYEYDAPDISPEFYLLGPLKFLEKSWVPFSPGKVVFQEIRKWQIATDGLARTWTGNVDGNWSNPGNWSPSVAPVAGDDLVFPGSVTTYSTNNDFDQDTLFNSITISGSGYTLSGNDIILGQGPAGITDSASSGGNTISLNIRMDATRWIVVSNSGETLTISGKIIGVGGLTKEGLGKLVLSGANKYGGVTKVNVGTLNARNATALGTIAGNTEVVGEAALEIQGGIAIGREALTIRGYGNSSQGALRNIQDNNSFDGLITIAGTTKIASDSDILTLNGGVTGTFSLILDGVGNITFEKASLGAAAATTVTKNGSGTVTYNFPNTYTGLTTVNAGMLRYGCDNAMMTGGITVNGGTLDIGSYSDMQGTITLGTLAGNEGTITGTTGILSSATWTVYAGTISAIMGGYGGAVTKSTFGTVTLTRPNQFTGAVTVSVGILKIQDSMALGLIDGATSVTSGATLQIDGDGLSIPEYITLNGLGLLNQGALRNSTGDNSITALLALGAASKIDSDSGTTLTIATGGINGATFGLTVDGSGNTTITGPIATTSGTLIKNGSGTLTLTASNPFTGATTINHGILALSGNGSIATSASISTNSGSKMVIDNSSVVVDRVGDASGVTMNGGDIQFYGNSSASTIATMGALTMSTGQNAISVFAAAGGSTILRFASLTRTAGATGLIRGTSLGSTPGANVATILFTTAPTLKGDDGEAGTPRVSVIQGMFGDNSTSGTGTDMVTYGRGNNYGVRLLNGAGFSNEYTTDLTMTNGNVKLSASTTAVTSQINSLILGSGVNITDAGSSKIMTFISGNILNFGTSGSIAGANTTLAGGAVEFIIRAAEDLDISSLITTTGGLSKCGSGTLTFSTAKTYTGLTSVNAGTLLYGANDAINSGAVTVNDATLDIATYTDSVGAVTLQEGTLTGDTGVLTGSSFNLRASTVSARIAGSGTLTIANTNERANAESIITRDNPYAGAITVTSGVLKLGGAGDVTNTPLGTTAASTSISSGAMLDLNGFTLGTAETINTFIGTGIALQGAIINSSGTPVSYSGNLTIATSAMIGANNGKITISGTISGAGLPLTVGGFGDIDITGAITTGAGAVTKVGFGTYTPSSVDSDYSGTTTVSAGKLKLGSAGGGTNGPLGMIAGATSIATGATMDLNGYTLGTAELINTLLGIGAGSGDFATGALINSSGTSVSYSGTITINATTMIRADYGAITLSAITGSDDALVLAGSTGGTIGGVIGIGTGTLTKLGAGSWTLSGQNTFTGAPTLFQGTIKLGVAGNGIQSPLGTVTATTTVYSGAVLDLNGYALGIAKPLTVNGFGIANGGALVNNSVSGVTYSGTRALGSDSRTTNSGAGLLTLSGIQSGVFESRYGGAGDTTISVAIAATASSLLKDGEGILNLTAANGLTGATMVDAGTVKAGIANALSSGILVVRGGTYDMNGYSDTVGAVTLITGTIASTGGGVLTGTAYTLESGTISGVITGAIAVVKNTAGKLTITGAETISSTITLNAGTVEFSGSGTATSVTGITVNLGATLTLDNSTTNVGDRIGNIAITMNGGNLNFIGQDSTTVTESINQLAFATGHNTVTIDPKAGSGGSGTTLTVTNATCFNRTAGATVLFRGTNFGSTPAAGVSSLVCSTSPTLSGGGGAADSKTVSIIKGAFGDSSLTGTGSDMVTYNVGNTTGLRLLNGAGYTTEYQSDLSVASANVKLTASTAATSNNTNSLILNGFTVNDASVTMPMANGTSLAGNILINSANSIDGANTVLGITTNELPVLATANGTISATIGTATTGSLTLSGSGNTTLSAANAYTGTTYINNATLTEGVTNTLSTGGVTVVGGTFDLNGNSDSVGAITATAGTIQTGAGTLTTTGTVATVADANLSSKISGTLTLPAAATLNIAQGLVENDAVISATITGAGTSLTKSTGTGVVVLSGNNTNAGTMPINAGTVKLGTAGSSGNGPLGTTAAGTTVASGAALDLNGYTLNNAEATTINGTGLTANVQGAILNNSAVAVSYSGTLTLGAASTIEADYGDVSLTSTGTVSGAYALTLRGAGNGSFDGVMANVASSIVKNDLGTWTLSGNSQHTGVTTITLGVLKLGAAGSGSYGPLGTTGTGTTIASGAMLDLDGYILATAENLTSVSGTGIANAGAITTSSASSTSYSGAITLAAASRLTNFGSGTFSFSGALAGAFQLTLVSSPGIITQTSASAWTNVAGGFTKEGVGVAVLAGQNQFTSTVTVSTGTLQLGASGGGTYSPLGTNGAGTTVSLGAVLDTATYQVNNPGVGANEAITLSGTGLNNGGALKTNSASTITFGALTLPTSTNARISNSGAGILTISGAVSGTTAGSLFIDGSGPTTISGSITSTFLNVTKNDAGILILSGAANATTTGFTRINGGTLKYGVANAINTGSVTVAGGTLDINGQTDAVGAITLISGSISNTGAAATLTGTGYTFYGGAVNVPLGGTAIAMAKITGETTTINTGLTNTGLLTINAGKVQYLTNDVIADTASVTVAGGTLDVQTYTDTFTTLTLTSGGVIGSGAGTITGTATPAYIVSSGNISAILAGAVNLRKTTTGTVTLSGLNTYTGVTDIQDGTLSVSTIKNGGVACGLGQATNAAANLTSTTGTGTIQYTGGTDSTDRNITTTAAITLQIDVTDPSTSLTWSGATTGTAALLNKVGPGTLILSGANLHTGVTSALAGTLEYGADNILLTGGVTVNNGTLDLNNYSDSVGAIILQNGGQIVDSGGTSAVLTSTAQFNFQSGRVSARLGSTVAAGLSKTTTDRVILSGDNTFTSTSVALSAGALNLQHNNALGASGTTLTTTVTGAANAVLETQNNVTIPSTKIFTINGTGVNQEGAIRNMADSNTLSGTIALGSTGVRINSYSGTLTCNGAMSGGGYNVTFGGAGNTVYGAAIGTAAGTLTKDGIGTLTLSVANSYTGLTTVSAGVAVANNATSFGTTGGGVIVATGAAVQMQNSITVGVETLTLNGDGISNSGALRSTSGTNIWQGNVTLSSNTSIGVDANTLQISGSITGGASIGLTKVGAASLTVETTTLGGDLNILAGTLVANGSSAIGVGGSWTNSATFTPNTSLVTFNSGSTGKTIDAGGTGAGKSFYDVTFNNSAGGWTIGITDMKVAHNLIITDVNSWTVDSGRTLEVSGTYSIANAETSATTWTGSIFYLNGTSQIVGSKTQSEETYGTLQIGANTDVRMWNSSASAHTVDVTGSLYSMDYDNNNGDLYIWGDYHTLTNDYWSYATDFDGTSLSGSERQVDARIDPSANITVDSGDTLAGIGAASANRSNISRQGSSSGYGIIVDGGTINFQYADFEYLDGDKGLDIRTSSTVTSLDYCKFNNLVSAGASDAFITVASTIIGSAQKTLTGVQFDDIGGGAEFNVNRTGSDDSGYWTFDSSTGDFDGEDYDGDDGVNEADPGMLRWVSIDTSGHRSNFEGVANFEGAIDFN